MEERSKKKFVTSQTFYYVFLTCATTEPTPANSAIKTSKLAMVVAELCKDAEAAAMNPILWRTFKILYHD